MTEAHCVFTLACHASKFSIFITYLFLPLSPKTPSPPKPAISQHSSGPPHRVPLCQWAGREHTVQPLTMGCRWTHLTKPQTTLYSTLNTHTLPHRVSISSLIPSFSSISNSTIHSILFRSHILSFWKSAIINRLHPLFF